MDYTKGYYESRAWKPLRVTRCNKLSGLAEKYPPDMWMSNISIYVFPYKTGKFISYLN